MIRSSFCLSSLAPLGLAVFAACADAEPGDVTGDTTLDATDGALTRDRQVEGRVQQCLDRVEAGDECGECACRHCIDPLAVCEPDPDCRAIRECAHEALCTGVECLGPCGDVIRAHGGPFGAASQLAQKVGVCVDRHCAGPC